MQLGLKSLQGQGVQKLQAPVLLPDCPHGEKTVPNIQSEYCLSFSHHAPIWGPWLCFHENTTGKALPIIFLQCCKGQWNHSTLAPCKGVGHMIPAWFRTTVNSLPYIRGTVTDWMHKETVGRLVRFKQSWNGLWIWKNNQVSFTVVILWTGECFLQCWKWKEQTPELPALLSRRCPAGFWSTALWKFSGVSCQPSGITLCVMPCFLVGLRPWGGRDIVNSVLQGIFPVTGSADLCRWEWKG